MPEIPDEPSSIHWRRRWWYVVWAGTLLSCLGLWAWWETPAARGEGHVALVFKPPLPQGLQADWWAGPKRTWKGDRADFQGTIQGPEDPNRTLNLPLILIRVSLRHLNKGYIPRGTTDWIVVRFRVPNQPTRYLAYNLGGDLNRGFIGPHRRMQVRLPIAVEKLSQDPTHPSLVN